MRFIFLVPHFPFHVLQVLHVSQPSLLPIGPHLPTFRYSLPCFKSTIGENWVSFFFFTNSLNDNNAVTATGWTGHSGQYYRSNSKYENQKHFSSCFENVCLSACENSTLHYIFSYGMPTNDASKWFLRVIGDKSLNASSELILVDYIYYGCPKDSIMFFRCYSKAIWPSTPPAINSTHAV
jgi:hypothetical protein